MKILIVYTIFSSKSRTFESLIKNEIANQKIDIDAETEFYIRNSNEIEDILYEQTSGFLKKSNGVIFDSFDMIFITGSPKILPWDPKFMHILVLLRMCLKTRKMLFACGAAFLGLVFLCATNLEKGSLNVQNAKTGCFFSIDELKNINVNIKKIDASDVYVDNITGDIYSYSYETTNWQARGNIGIHLHKAAESSAFGKFVLPTPAFKVCVADNSHKKNFATKVLEKVINVRKNFYHHWALTNHEFLAPMLSQWQVHPFNFRVKNKTFDVLADCNVGPQIITFTNDNVLATQFELSKTYPDTVSILRNFLRKKLVQMKHCENLCISVFNADFSWAERMVGIEKLNMKDIDKNPDGLKKSSFDIQNEKKHKRNISLGNGRDLAHCGYSTSIRGFYFVKNNAIQANVVVNPIISIKQDAMFQDINNMKVGEVNQDVSSPNKNKSFFASKKTFKKNKNLYGGSNIRPGIHNKINAYTDESRNLNESKIQNEVSEIEKKRELCHKENKHTIRKILIPDWKEDTKLGWNNDDWVPGYRTFFKIFDNDNTCGRAPEPSENQPATKGRYRVNKKFSKLEFDERGQHTSLVMKPPKVVNKSCNPRFFTQYYKKHRHFSPDDRYKGSLREEYTTTNKVLREWQLREDKKILFHKSFIVGLDTKNPNDTESIRNKWNSYNRSTYDYSTETYD